MKRALLLFALVAALVGGAYFLAAAVAAAGTNAFDVLSTPYAWAAVLGGSVIFASSYVPSAHVWRRLLRWRGIDLSPSEALALLLRTTPAKYLPGNIAQPMGRAAGLALAGAPLRGALATLIEEASLSLGVAILLGLAVGYFVMAHLPEAMASFLPGLFAASILAILLASVVLVVDGRAHRWAASITPVVRPARIMWIGAGYVVVMALIGSSMWIACVPVIGSDLNEWALILSAFLLAWTLGSLVPGAPAGLGVRDAALVWMLSPYFADGAVVIAAVARLTSVFGDCIAFLAGLLLLGQGRARKP